MQPCEYANKQVGMLQGNENVNVCSGWKEEKYF